MTPAIEFPSVTLLLIEDEPGLAESVRYSLAQEGYQVMVSDNGPAGLAQCRTTTPDLVLLDLMLPGMSGLDVCRQIRQFSDVPIIMLTAKDSEADKVLGLEVGADDYVTKPFSIPELTARIRAHLRRVERGGAQYDTSEVLRGGPIVLDIGAHETRVGDRTVDLRPKEFVLLEALLRRKGRLATRHALIDEVWGPSYFGDTKTLDVHIKRLREKLEPNPSNPVFIVTVRGLGYKFVDG